MNCFVLSGSHRKNSQSERIGQHLVSRLETLFPTSSVDFMSLAENPLPFWDEGIWENAEPWKSLWNPIKERLKAADAYVFITPEWGGMASPGIKNFFLLAAGEAMAHKPALLVGVSGSRNGAYPIAELRMSSYKNSMLSYIPEHLIVRDAESAFKDESQENLYLQKRCDYSLRMLSEYAKAFTQVRESGVVNLKDYPFGM